MATIGRHSRNFNIYALLYRSQLVCPVGVEFWLCATLFAPTLPEAIELLVIVCISLGVCVSYRHVNLRSFKAC
jgi:hypothetical protein